MKRSHSFDEFCTEEGLRVKRRKTTEKGGRRHLSGVTSSSSSDSQTTPSVCDATSFSQCNKGTATRNIIAEAFAIAQETGISNVCDATDLSQCKKDTAPRNIIAEAFAIAQETSISDVCDATNLSQCNKGIGTRNIIAEAFAISQETNIPDVCDATNVYQCNKDNATKNVIAEAFVISQETNISDVCDATNVYQCNKDNATKNVIAEAFVISQETNIPDVCDATNVYQCNKDNATKNIIAEAFVISQDTNIPESNTESSVQQAFETALDHVHVAEYKQQDCKASGGSVSEADSSAQLLTQADILGVLQGLSSVYNLADVSPENQPIQVVMNGSSMYLVGPQNQVYLSMVPQQGENVATPESQMLCTVEPNTNKVQQPADNLNYSQQFTSKSFSDKIKERIEDWYYKTMDVDHREARRLRFPSHLLEWSERVKIRHERKWQQLEYHAPDYSKFD